MGKPAAAAALDLPDPLKQNGKPTGGGKPAPADIGLGATDDLLAQLAGDEIDRLLAEAEVEGPGAEAPVELAQSPGCTSEALFSSPEPANFEKSELKESSVPSATEPEEQAKPEDSLVAHEIDVDDSPIDAAQGEVGAELDSLFAQLQSSDLKFKEVAEEESEPEPAPASEPIPAVAKTTSAPTTVKRETDSASAVAAELEADEKQHRVVKSAPSASSTPAAPTIAPAPASAVEKSAPAMPIWLRPLVWINAPFDALSEAIRNALGQIAIMTTVNAVAVLLYVWLFRGRH